MNNFLPPLGPREKALAAGAALLLFLLLGYGFLGRPLLARYQEYGRELPAQRELLAWMERSALTVKAQQANVKKTARAGGNDGLRTALTAGVRELQLEKYLKRMEPEGGMGLRVSFEEVSFAALIPLLARLQEREALVATEVLLERGREAGAVNAVLAFAGEQP